MKNGLGTIIIESKYVGLVEESHLWLVFNARSHSKLCIFFSCLYILVLITVYDIWFKKDLENIISSPIRNRNLFFNF